LFSALPNFFPNAIKTCFYLSNVTNFAAGLVYAAARFDYFNHSQRRHTTPKKQDDERLHMMPQDGDNTAEAAAKAAIELSRAGSGGSN
jgi:hypothetical protein